MTPPTVNASYNPPTNILTFPAGILQPPFFMMDADDAVNYGAIGAVIGHEMGHGFDDQGSKYDAEGKLKNWWRRLHGRSAILPGICARVGGPVAARAGASAIDHGSASAVEEPGQFTLAEHAGIPQGVRMQAGRRDGKAHRSAVQTLVEKIAEIQERGYCVLEGRFPDVLIRRCREAFWPILLDHIGAQSANRGEHRHFLPMPFTPPCFAPEFFFDPTVLAVVHGIMGGWIVADQWGCDVPVRGSIYQEVHVDYKRPLFAETPELRLPFYMLVVSFGLADIGLNDGPIEIAPGSHRTPHDGAIDLEPVTLKVGDVLIRHPWALHRGTPNRTDTPRAMATIRYVRRWYADDSRDVCAIPAAVWQSLTGEQRSMMRFPLEVAG
jgi:hypothetical protein